MACPFSPRGQKKLKQMKSNNNFNRLLYGLFFLILFTTSCIKEKDIVPELTGIPGGGLLDAEVKTVNGNSVTFRLDLFAVNQYGDFIENLDGKCLSVDDNYPQAELVTISRGDNIDKGSYSAALLFDQSGSITGTDPDDARVEAGKGFVDIMGSGDEVALTAFSSGGYFPGNPSIVHTFSDDKDDLKIDICDLADKEDGGTPLYYSIYNLVCYVNDNAKNSNKAVIVMTDGEDTEGLVIPQSIIDIAQAKGVEIYTIGLGSLANYDVLQEIALGTGGAVMLAQDALQLISLYNSLADLLRGNGVFYETCWQLKKPGGGAWQSGDVIITVINLSLPTGETIEFPVRLVIP